MSRHFNYELDERRIKILLNENSMSFSEDVWNEFVEKTKPIEKVNKLPAFKLNFAINRSVLLTGIFIVLIGSFTLVVAKFVDFSATKSNTESLREVKPDPNNFKLEKIATALPQKQEAKATPTIAVQTTSLATTQVSATSVPTAATNYTNYQNNNYASNTQTYTDPGNQNNSMARTIPDSVAGVKDSTATASKPRFLKKKKKEVEPMETKPLTTGLPTTNPDEQEPELKLD